MIDVLIKRVQKFTDIKKRACWRQKSPYELKAEYVRKSVGNALQDISRKHPNLIAEELKSWDTSKKPIAQVYQLASKFIGN